MCGLGLVIEKRLVDWVTCVCAGVGVPGLQSSMTEIESDQRTIQRRMLMRDQPLRRGAGVGRGR